MRIESLRCQTPKSETNGSFEIHKANLNIKCFFPLKKFKKPTHKCNLSLQCAAAHGHADTLFFPAPNLNLARRMYLICIAKYIAINSIQSCEEHIMLPRELLHFIWTILCSFCNFPNWIPPSFCIAQGIHKPMMFSGFSEIIVSGVYLEKKFTERACSQ